MHFDRDNAFDRLTKAIALLVLTAAALKAYELATRPVTEHTWLTSRWVRIALVEWEILFGLALISKLPKRLKWLAAFWSFVVFAGVSFFHAVAGHATCGCFGRLEVSPWWTLALDIVVIALLLAVRPQNSRQNDIQPITVGNLAYVFLAVGLPVAVIASTYTPAVVAAHGGIVGDSEFVILEPEEWIGSNFPVANFIDDGDALLDGKWVVLFYHVGCPKCQEAIPKYQRLAAHETETNVALVEVPPYGQLRFPKEPKCLWTRLSNEREWFVSAPVEVVVEDGAVQSTSTSLDSIAAVDAAMVASSYGEQPW